MRHPFLEHPTHPELRGVNDAYYFGPSLYVAPVLRRGENSVTRLLPPGNFLDWQSQKLILGRTTHTQTVTLSAPLAKLPILLRENRLLPLLDASIDTLADETSSAVVGRNDVSHVYDVVALLGQRGDASLQLWDGTVLHARKQGTWLAPAGFRPVNDDTTLKSCTECYRLQRLADNLLRLQINPPGQNTVAGGLRLSTSGARQIRWDLYLAQ